MEKKRAEELEDDLTPAQQAELQRRFALIRSGKAAKVPAKKIPPKKRK
jgi:hypothetical protein